MPNLYFLYLMGSSPYCKVIYYCDKIIVMIKKIYNRKITRYTAFVVLPIWLVSGIVGLAVQMDLLTSGAELSLAPVRGAYGEGKAFSVDVVLLAKDPVNTVGVTLEYDPTLLEVLGISKKGSVVNLWIEEPSYDEGLGSVRFSGGITLPKGFTGKGKLATILFRARTLGEARVKITNANVLAHDGSGTDILLHTYSGVFAIVRDGIGDVPSDLDGNGVIEMKDIIVFVSHWEGSYDAIYDFNKNGKIDFPDLISLVYKIRQASR